MKLWKTVITAGAAFAAYIIGSGFASGAEILQYFGSWGVAGNIVSILFFVVGTIYTTYIVFEVCKEQHFDSHKDLFVYYSGKWGAKFFDAFTFLTMFLLMTTMCAGAGATINQLWGTPVIVGAIILVAVSALVAATGIQKVIDTIGWLGIVIIVVIVISGIWGLASADIGFMEGQQRAFAYAEEGKVLQAGIFGIYNPLFSGLNYVGFNFICTTPFVVTLAERFKNKKEAFAGAVSTGVTPVIAVLLVLCAMMGYIDEIVASDAQIPLLKAVQHFAPFLAPLIGVIIVLGIFTTVTSYMTVTAGRFFKEKTLPYYLTILAFALLGIFGSSIFPFAKMVNFLFPIFGFVGMAHILIATYRLVFPKKGYLKKEEQGE